MPTQQSEESLLRDILRQRSIRRGSFTLASGQISDIYIDARLTTCSADAMALVGRVFLRRMRERGWFPRAAGGLTMGADPIAFAIARESATFGGDPINAFVVRKEPKKHGLGKYIEGIEETQGLPVVIIEDVCTTGGSTALAIERALAAGMRVIGAICLVDREMGATGRISGSFNIPLESIFKLADL
jgi:orotate phosphoribosyltransferase